MTEIIRGNPAKRPTVTPIKSSVLDHAKAAGNLHDNPRFALANNTGLFPSYNCLDTAIPTPVCPDPLAGTDDVEPKEFATAPWVQAFWFTIYGGAQCNAVGLDRADQKNEVTRVFRANEGKAVEAALLENRFVERTSDPTLPSFLDSTWGAPIDLTPTARSLEVAFALLESYARRTYAGQPTLHLPAAAASLLGSDKIVWEGDLAYSRLGSKVAFGGGYDTNEIVDLGQMDLYATGEVSVERGAEVLIQEFEHRGTPGDVDGAPNANSVLTLAERSYRVAVDCFVAKATGIIWS